MMIELHTSTLILALLIAAFGGLVFGMTVSQT